MGRRGLEQYNLPWLATLLCRPKPLGDSFFALGENEHEEGGDEMANDRTSQSIQLQ
jgi:hypothetical protein